MVKLDDAMVQVFNERNALDKIIAEKVLEVEKLKSKQKAIHELYDAMRNYVSVLEEN